jgi:hypothetical protein
MPWMETEYLNVTIQGRQIKIKSDRRAEIKTLPPMAVNNR